VATFTITTANQSPTNVYIQSAALNGKPLTSPFLRHSDIVAGGRLELVMGPNPDAKWAKAPVPLR
jgi:putative alpha-1,2-mannosidase